MINPNRMHRARGVVQTIRTSGVGGFVLVNGHVLETFQDLRKFRVGDVVNIQAKFSIVLDAYIVKTVRKIKPKRQDRALYGRE